MSEFIQKPATHLLVGDNIYIRYLPDDPMGNWEPSPWRQDFKWLGQASTPIAFHSDRVVETTLTNDGGGWIQRWSVHASVWIER